VHNESERKFSEQMQEDLRTQVADAERLRLVRDETVMQIRDKMQEDLRANDAEHTSRGARGSADGVPALSDHDTSQDDFSSDDCDDRFPAVELNDEMLMLVGIGICYCGRPLEVLPEAPVRWSCVRCDRRTTFMALCDDDTCEFSICGYCVAIAQRMTEDEP